MPVNKQRCWSKVSSPHMKHRCILESLMALFHHAGGQWKVYQLQHRSPAVDFPRGSRQQGLQVPTTTAIEQDKTAVSGMFYAKPQGLKHVSYLIIWATAASEKCRSPNLKARCSSPASSSPLPSVSMALNHCIYAMSRIQLPRTSLERELPF